jgi:hypothetical protein
MSNRDPYSDSSLIDVARIGPSYREDGKSWHHQPAFSNRLIAERTWKGLGWVGRQPGGNGASGLTGITSA